MPDIHLKDIPDEELQSALYVAQRFISEYPDRSGMRDAVGVTAHTWYFVVYRTAKGCVVVTSNSAPHSKEDGDG